MKKGIAVFLIIATVFISAPISVLAEAFTVLAGEGGVELEKQANYFKKAAKEVCGSKGYFEININKEKIRFEIDEEGGVVPGRGGAVISFSQNCPGDAVSKLLKKEGTIFADISLFGTKFGKNISGTYKMDLNIPTLISFSTSISGPWKGQYNQGILSGEISLEISQLGFGTNLYFKIPMRQEEPQLISLFSKKVAAIRAEVSELMGQVGSYNFNERDKGVFGLKWILYNKLPVDRRPLGDIDPLPEIQALFDVFEGFILCVDKNVEQQSGGNPQWETCFYQAGAVLERSEKYIRQISPPSAASELYFVLASLWDRLRYYALYAPENVKYDKVEICNRAKEKARKALWADSKNGSAKNLLDQLETKAGCKGMPLFGINKEEINRQAREAFKKTQQRMLENLEQGQNLRDKADEITGVDKISEEDGEENSDDLVDQTLNNRGNVVNQTYSAIKDFVRENYPGEAESIIGQVEQAAGETTEQKISTIRSWILSPPQEKGITLKEGASFLTEFSSNLLTAADVAERIDDTMMGISGRWNWGWGQLSKGNAGLGDVVGAGLNAVSAGFSAYDNINKEGALVEGAVVGATMNVEAKIALGALLPQTMILDLGGAALKYGGMAAGGMKTRTGAVMLGFSNAAPGAVIDNVTNNAVTSDYADMGGVVVEMWREIGTRGGVWGTTTEIVNFGATAGYTAVVATAHTVGGVVTGAVKGVGSFINWLKK